MKLPRDLSGFDLAKALEHHLTIPAHDPLKIGTLAAIPSDVALHLKLDRDGLLDRLFG